MSKPISQVVRPVDKLVDVPQSHSENDLQIELDTFIAQIGERVLSARRSLGMSRRVLSESSGVSSRTIVLLETGVGNITIALLFRIAKALGHSVEWFISSTEQTRHDADRVADYYLAATPINQQHILNILGAHAVKQHKRQRICLIGLRGAGKSTLGDMLSQSLSLPFVELNSEVEKLGGLSIQEVMDLYGQEGYRRLERQALENCVSTHDNFVLAAAGGVVLDSVTHTFLLKNFHTVWLKASPEEHMDRVKRQGDNRPMAGNPAAMAQLRSILTDREPLYALSDATVDTGEQTVEAALSQLECCVRKLLNVDESSVGV